MHLRCGERCGDPAAGEGNAHESPRTSCRTPPGGAKEREHDRHLKADHEHHALQADSGDDLGFELRADEDHAYRKRDVVGRVRRHARPRKSWACGCEHP